MNWKPIRQEPYRLLFPLGLASATVGIGMWIPYYCFPKSFPYPGPGHATLQIQAFLLCFILGFLCTMLPKVLAVAPLGPIQFTIFPIAILGVVLASLSNDPRLAQALHFLMLLNFFAFIFRRWKTRGANPPSPFAFIALAMASDMLGTAFHLLNLFGVGGFAMGRAGVLLQFQAFPLLLILGVGSFLLPKLFGNGEVNQNALREQPRKSSWTFLPWGLVFVLSYLCEAWFPGSLALRLAAASRAAIWIWFLFCPIRIHRIPPKLPAYLAGAKYSLISIGMGLLMPVFLPLYALAWEHLIFITGLLWLTLSVATRVLTAHGGRLDLLTQHRKKILALGWLFVLAMCARVSTDIWTKGHWMHMAVAAAFALLGLGIWAWIYFPLLRAFPVSSRK